VTDRAQTEKLIARFGEQYRNLIEKAIEWLDETEPSWGLKRPIGRTGYIKGLIGSVAKDRHGKKVNGNEQSSSD
jgi:hypothetical protein